MNKHENDMNESEIVASLQDTRLESTSTTPPSEKLFPALDDAPAATDASVAHNSATSNNPEVEKTDSVVPVQVSDTEPIVPPPDPVLERLDAMAGKLDLAGSALDSLRERTDSLQKAVTGFYTQTTDEMHRELEKFRKGLVRKLEQELFGELIDLYDTTDRAIACVADNPSKACLLLEGIRDQIDAALFNRGVEKREATKGEKFDGRRHHVARPDVPTGNASLDGLIASTAKPGFDDMDESFKDLRGGCMKLRPIHVRLYKFDPALATPVEPVTPEQPAPQPEEPAPAPTTEAEPESVAAPAETPSSESEARS